MGGANIWPINHESCHLALHWSTGNTFYRDLVRDIVLLETKWGRSVVLVERDLSAFLPFWTTYLCRKAFWESFKVAHWHNTLFWIAIRCTTWSPAHDCLLSKIGKMFRIQVRWESWTNDEQIYLLSCLSFIRHFEKRCWKDFFCQNQNKRLTEIISRVSRKSKRTDFLSSFPSIVFHWHGKTWKF